MFQVLYTKYGQNMGVSLAPSLFFFIFLLCSCEVANNKKRKQRQNIFVNMYLKVNSINRIVSTQNQRNATTTTNTQQQQNLSTYLY